MADPKNDKGLSANDCYPRGNPANDYQGFALLNNDPWYDGRAAARALTAGYRNEPPANAKKRKRSWVDPEQIVVVGVNLSRRTTGGELRDKFSLLRCESDGYKDELREYADDSAVPYGPPVDEVHAPVDAPVLSPITLGAEVFQTTATPPTPQEGVGEVKLARQTQA